MAYDEAYAAFYVDRTINSPYTQYKYEVAADMLGELGSTGVLDIGCNINPVHEKGLRRHVEGVGVDYFGVDVTDAYFAGAEEPVPAVVGDATDLEFEDESFAAVFAGDVLEHIPDLPSVARQISRVLQPGGRALIVVPSLYKLDAFDLPEIHDVRDSSHVHFKTPQTWQEDIEAAAPDLHLIEETSRGLGVLSGISYFSWTHEGFITAQTDVVPPTEDQILSNLAKKEASALDRQADAIVQGNGQTAEVMAGMLRTGQFVGAMTFFRNQLGVETPSLRVLGERFTEVADSRSVELGRRVVESEQMEHITSRPWMIGNSVLLQFQKV